MILNILSTLLFFILGFVIAIAGLWILVVCFVVAVFMILNFRDFIKGRRKL